MKEVVQYHPLSEKILETIELPAGTFYPDIAQINAKLSERLELQDLEIKIDELKWQLDEEINIQENDNLNHLSFSLMPLEGEMHWIMDLNEISKITSWALTKDETAKAFSSEILQEGFYHYLILEAMDAIDQDSILNRYSLKILPEAKDFQGPFLCIDVRIIYRGRSAHAKLIIPKTMIQSWKKYFFKEPDLILSKTASLTNFFLSVNAGRVNLFQSTFENISVGDFIILDHSYYDPKTHQGNVLLSFNQTNLYLGKLKQNKLKILDISESKEDFMENTEQITPVNEVSLPIHVEMGKIEMSLEKLMSLKPGEVIETTIGPNENVSLVLNNKTIGKGELIKVGETIGIRILELS